jgi:hypothetical protein
MPLWVIYFAGINCLSEDSSVPAKGAIAAPFFLALPVGGRHAADIEKNGRPHGGLLQWLLSVRVLREQIRVARMAASYNGFYQYACSASK